MNYLYGVEILQYKIADKTDIPVIHDLARRIWNQHYPAIITQQQIDYMLDKMYSAEALASQMDQGHQFRIVSEGAAPLGYLSFSDQGNGDFFLHKFYIDTTLHRKGIGSRFFDQVFGGIPGLQRIRLTVNRKNNTAINFYFRKGFVIEEVKDFDIGNGYEMNDFILLRTTPKH